MTKPGADFEKAVYAFAKTLDPSAEVIFDHKVLDRDTNTPRQCDVWINAKFGGHWPLSILVSCKDHGRPLDIGDIEKFRGEVQSTGADAGVIYSRRGFYEPAVKKAKANHITCCRLYQDEPADIPDTIILENFACTPQYMVTLRSNLSGTNTQTWNDLFNIVEGEKTVLDLVLTESANAEALSIEKSKRQGGFPPDWTLDLAFEAEDTHPEISLQIACHWKWYHAPKEATLLNGSYCLSDQTFRGAMVGPAIDTQGSHPGEDWIEITERTFRLPTNRVVAILYKGDMRAAFRESLGSKALPVVVTNE